MTNQVTITHPTIKDLTPRLIKRFVENILGVSYGGAYQDDNRNTITIFYESENELQNIGQRYADFIDNTNRFLSEMVAEKVLEFSEAYGSLPGVILVSESNYKALEPQITNGLLIGCELRQSKKLIHEILCF